ncbi:GDSL esterase/lipase-like [Dorcoceras hygrometricum]|uniref:GDSL esterase/lipase-like n=1 Tax=Dorcoceras hygrometricum TaxID=472368 RepID=A0A2Z7AN47_9LAMI|nr:GDSL esterase/lipase-like [Dorcoceras hygrometricum]
MASTELFLPEGLDPTEMTTPIDVAKLSQSRAITTSKSRNIGRRDCERLEGGSSGCCSHKSQVRGCRRCVRRNPCDAYVRQDARAKESKRICVLRANGCENVCMNNEGTSQKHSDTNCWDRNIEGVRKLCHNSRKLSHSLNIKPSPYFLDMLLNILSSWFHLNQLVSNLPSISGQTLHLSCSLSWSASEFFWIKCRAGVMCLSSSHLYIPAWLYGDLSSTPCVQILPLLQWTGVTSSSFSLSLKQLGSALENHACTLHLICA